LLPIHYADVCNYGSRTYTLIAQEYLANGTVANHLNPGNFLPLPVTLRVLQDILFGLEYLHNSGFYHNDIKPGNILFDDQFGAVLGDYGIAGFSPSTSPVAPSNAYKIHRAPETATGTPLISIQTDIFQVGCTAYRLLNGITVLKNEYTALGETLYEENKAKGKIPSRTAYEAFVPSQVRAVINKSLSVNPALRFQSALEMRRKLERLHFPAYWTVDASSRPVGVGKKYKYQFEIEAKPNHLFNFTSTKRSNVSGITTKVSGHCSKSLSETTLEKCKKDFISWVVENGD
jgi:serine/threonine protein kinase